MNGVRAASNHNLRLGNFGKNVDSELTKDNFSYSINDATPYENIKRLWEEVGEQREQLGAKKLRSDTNRAVEVIVGASADFFKDKDPKQTRAFFADQLNWLKKEYAGKGTLVHAIVHLDEPTAAPHMQAIFAPIKNKATKVKGGKEVVAPTFSAKEFMGNPTDLIAARTSQYEALGDKWGLKRGTQYDENTDPQQKILDGMPLKEFKVAMDKQAIEMLKHFDIDALKQMAINFTNEIKFTKYKEGVMKKIDAAFAENDKDAMAQIIVKNQPKKPGL